MNKDFKYEVKETYTAAEMEAIGTQYGEFISKSYKGFVKPEDHEKVLAELQPFKTEKRNNHIRTLAKDLTSEDKLKGAIAMSGITAEDDDATISTKLKKTIEENKFLQKDNGVAPELIKKKEQEKTKIDDKFKGL